MLSRRTTKTGKTVAVARPAIMPHVSSSGGGDDLGSEDEVKVFKDEGEDEKRSSENLTEEKSSLIDLTESEEKGSLAGGSYSTTGKTSARSDLSPVFGKVDPTPHTSSFNMGYLVSPYPYPNGAGGPIPVSMVSVADTVVRILNPLS